MSGGWVGSRVKAGGVAVRGGGLQQGMGKGRRWIGEKTERRAIGEENLGGKS